MNIFFIEFLFYALLTHYLFAWKIDAHKLGFLIGLHTVIKSYRVSQIPQSRVTVVRRQTSKESLVGPYKIEFLFKKYF